MCVCVRESVHKRVGVHESVRQSEYVSVCESPSV